MFRNSKIAIAFAAVLVNQLVMPLAHGATYYWDNNGATAGFGTATGTWAATTTGNATQGFSTDGTGATLPANVTPTTSDSINFGNGATGLAAGTITVSGTVSANSVNFASGSGAITLTGGTISTASIISQNTGDIINSNISLNAAGTVSFSLSTAAVGTMTINGQISGGQNLSFTTPNVNSGGNLQTIVLNNTNTYTGTTSITTGNSNNSLYVIVGVANALPTSTVLTLNGGNGVGSGRSVSYDLNGVNQTLAGLTNTQFLYDRSQKILNSPGTTATLTINDSGSRTFSGSIQGTNLGVTKTGSGTWTVAGANSYTGPTIINGGSIVLDFSQVGSGSASAPSNYISSSSTLSLGNGASFSLTGRPNGSAVSAAAWTGGATSNVAKVTFSTLPSGIQVGQAVTGTGIGASAYIVAIDSANKTVILNVNDTAASGTFTTSATNFTVSQTFASTTLNAGAAALSINANSGSGTKLALSAITRNVGSTVDFTQPAGTISASNGFTTSTTNTANTILGGWATVGGANWANNNGTNIVALSSYTLTSVAGTASANYATKDISVDSSPAVLDAPVTINSLRFNAAGANTLTLAAGNNVISSGGILVTSAVGNNLSTITGGTLAGASGTDLVVIQNNSSNGLTISSVLANNGSATGLTKSGAGLLTVTGTNTYSGQTTLNAGTLNANSTDALGDGSVTNTLVFEGGTLQAGGTITSGSNRSISLPVSGTIDTNNNTVSIAGNISGVGSLTKNGLGTLTLSGTNTYSGNTTVNNGTVNVTGTISSSGTLSLGTTGSVNTILNVSNDMTLNSVVLPTVANGIAIYNQTAGTVNANLTSATNGYAYFNLTGGTFKTGTGGELIATSSGVGVAYIGGTGVLDLTNDTSNGGIAWSGAASLTVGPGGTLSRGAATGAFYFTAFTNGYGAMNVAGGNVDLSTGIVRVGNGTGQTNQTAFLNLASGTLTVSTAISPLGASGNFYVNFAGGTLKATAGATSISSGSGTTTISTIFGAIDNSAAVGNTTQNFTGGLLINNDKTVAISTGLMGATASGVLANNISITGGTGYVGAPLVQFTGGTLATNGTPASGYALISGGAVTGIVITSPGEYTVAPTITLTGGGGTGASATISALTTNVADGGVTKSGAGDFNLSGTSTYVGNTSISNGRIAVSSPASLSNGATAITTSGTGQLFLNGGTNTYSNAINLGGTGYTETGDANNNNDGQIRLDSNQTLSGTITLLANARVGSYGNSTATLSGQITGAFGIDFYGMNGANNISHVFILSNATNNYTGNTSIYSNDYQSARTGGSTTLRLGASSVIPSGASAGNVVFNGADADHLTILDLNGFNQTINGTTVIAAAGAQITNNATGTSTLTVGSNNTTSSFSGLIADGGVGKVVALTKTGSGIFTLSGANTFSGDTNIGSGTLKVNNTTGSGTGTGAVNVNNGGTLGGTGSIAGAVTVNNGGTLAPGNSPGTLSMTGGLTITSGSILNYDLDTTPAGTNDLIAVTGNLSLAAATLNINAYNTTLSNGTYKLITYTGTLTGDTTGWAIGTNTTVGSHLYSFSTATGGEVDLIVTAASSPLPTGSGTWKNVSADGKWSTNTGANTNWATAYPSVVDNVATFDDTVTGTPGTVDLNGNQTVGSVAINTTTNGYTLGLANTANTLTLQVSSGTASIAVTGGGSHTINAQVVTASNATISVAGTSSLNLAQGIDNSTGKTVNLSNNSSGTLTSGNISNGTGGNVNVSGTVSTGTISGAGTTTVAANANLTVNNITGSTPATGGIVSIQGSVGQPNAVLTMNATPTAGPTDAGSGGASGTMVLSSLSISNVADMTNGHVLPTTASPYTPSSALTTSFQTYYGTLDLQNNNLVVAGGQYSQIQDMARSASDLALGGVWDGKGLTSSWANQVAPGGGAANHYNGSTAIGVIINNGDQTEDPAVTPFEQPLYAATGASLGTTFEGYTGLTGNETLVKYTWVGDANLDGKVDLSDYNLFAAGVSGATASDGLPGWFFGDFNYDGVVDLSDYNLLAAGISASNNGTISLPEPSTFILAAFGLLGLLVARRRKLKA